MGPGELPTIMTRRPSENDTDAQIGEYGGGFSDG